MYNLAHPYLLIVNSHNIYITICCNHSHTWHISTCFSLSNPIKTLHFSSCFFISFDKVVFIVNKRNFSLHVVHVLVPLGSSLVCYTFHSLSFSYLVTIYMYMYMYKAVTCIYKNNESCFLFEFLLVYTNIDCIVHVSLYMY